MERNKQELSSKTKKVKIKNRLKNFVKVLLHNSNKLKTLIQDGLTVLISVLIIYAIAQAGSLTPSAEPDSTMHSLSDIAGSGFATATHSLKALYDKINSLVADIWNKQTSELTTSGTIGKLLVDNLDTAISTRSSHSAADVWSVENRTITGGSLTNPDDYKADVSGLALDSEIGDPSDAAALNTTLFAGQQYIAENMAKTQWAGYAGPYNGDLGYYKGANEKCDSAYSGSHRCSFEEIIKLGSSYPYTYSIWINPPYWWDPGDVYTYTCFDWGTSISNKKGTIYNTSGDLSLSCCNYEYYLACCY